MASLATLTRVSYIIRLLQVVRNLLMLKPVSISLRSLLNTSVFPFGAHSIDLLAHFVGETDSVGSRDVLLELVCAPCARDGGRNRLWL